MSLENIQLDLIDGVIPPEAKRLIADGQSRVEEFLRCHGDEGYASFVPSDFSRVYTALLELCQRDLATGDMFCEWGSGMGIVAMLASMFDFDAFGIEIEPALVEEAERLADDHEMVVSFACGSYVQASDEAMVDALDEANIMTHGGGDGYEVLGFDPDDFDVIYAFPWPGEQKLIERLFDSVASVGALLMTYNGIEDVIVYRKVS